MLELPSILVVDADAEVLCDELARLGLDAEPALDAHAALTLLSDRTFDLALVEMDLPGLSGVGLLRRLSRMGCAVPFVGMSADPSPEDMVQLIRGGAADFLIKPFAATDVEDALERVHRRVDEGAPSHRPHAPSPIAHPDRHEGVCAQQCLQGESTRTATSSSRGCCPRRLPCLCWGSQR